MNRNGGERFAGLRALEGEENTRRFALSFSSEEPVERYFGAEILDHSAEAVDLTRLQELGCVLFNHKRDYVIGKVVSAEVTNGRGEAVIEFDDDDAADLIYKKVKSGTLKGVSVNYSVDTWEDVAPGKSSVDGRFMGPCCIARKWMPTEISIVSVPADATVGVGRELEAPTPGTRSYPLALAQCRLKINQNLMEVNNG